MQYCGEQNYVSPFLHSQCRGGSGGGPGFWSPSLLLDNFLQKGASYSLEHIFQNLWIHHAVVDSFVSKQIKLPTLPLHLLLKEESCSCNFKTYDNYLPRGKRVAYLIGQLPYRCMWSFVARVAHLICVCFYFLFNLPCYSCLFFCFINYILMIWTKLSLLKTFVG